MRSSIRGNGPAVLHDLLACPCCICTVCARIAACAAVQNTIGIRADSMSSETRCVRTVLAIDAVIYRPANNAGGLSKLKRVLTTLETRQRTVIAFDKVPGGSALAPACATC